MLESFTGLLMPLKSILLPSVSTISDKKMLRLPLILKYLLSIVSLIFTV
ncbi:hypothetical protein BAZSYMB_SCAFFOLD00028_8 [Bathymodiolus azoricus thioautotrophic gill symbiont]|uniref:Uncharacterized protein n=1 Tax=Bathymodiolus azoricus thioautotrophic gill symbiont TaxID=235205 RepID=A0A1H6KMC7_9GAMM|nr:hypothetical protein BAZSYMB_SCAFFOLD00028_8 [Bathymodiolus azoricus thioautotrophic gill symbiont]